MAAVGFMAVSACSAPVGQQAKDDVGPVTAYARNTLAAENPAGLVRLGEGFERSGDFLGARKLYAQAKIAAPDLVEARVAYARASAKAGFGDEAVAELILVLSDSPDHRMAKVTLAEVHANAARYRTALALLNELRDPSAEELVLRGKAAHASERHEEGHAALIGALDVSPGNPAVLQAAALSFALTADYASAVSLLRRAMDRPTAGVASRKSLALVYALSGQRQLALQLARDVVPASEMQRLDIHFRALPQFTKAEQAQLLFFDRIPANVIDRLTGRATN